MAQDDRTRIEALFTRSDGGFRFARRASAPAPAVLGVEEAAATVFEQELALACSLTPVPMVAEDPELGVNLFVIFVEDWAQLSEVPGLDRLIPDLADLMAHLGEANQYRTYAFDAEGAILLTITLLRLDDQLRSVPARALALSQSVQALLLWSDTAFAAESPVVQTEEGRPLVDPWFADLLRVAHDPEIPAASTDPALAERLAGGMAALRAARGS